MISMLNTLRGVFDASAESLADELVALSRALRWLTHPVRRGEITVEQFWLMRYLSVTTAPSVSELAGALGIAQSSATAACKRLARQGLITRVRDPADERRVCVALTAAGQARIETWTAHRRAAAVQVLGCLGPAEQEQLETLLARVRRALGAVRDGQGGAAPAAPPDPAAALAIAAGLRAAGALENPMRQVPPARAAESGDGL